MTSPARLKIVPPPALPLSPKDIFGQSERLFRLALAERRRKDFFIVPPPDTSAPAALPLDLEWLETED